MVRVAAALPPEAHLILCCHDELITDSPKALAQEVKVIMERCMNEAFRHYFGDVIPSDVVKIQVCTNWQEKKSAKPNLRILLVMHASQWKRTTVPYAVCAC